MITVFSEEHHLHDPKQEFHRGKLMDKFYENPERAEQIVSKIRESGLGDVVGPDDDLDLQPISEIHAPQYLNFLRTIYQQWCEEKGGFYVAPHVWSGRGLRDVEPESVYGRLAYYAFDAGTPIVAGTWQAAYSAAKVALTGAKLVQGESRVAFALTRPPGHHAARDVYGGYCFLNNAAIAAQSFINGGAKRVAILDVDFHHGNGTQSIFYDRADVLFVSLHGHPAHCYPYFLGYKEEIGEGPGAGFTANYPLHSVNGWSSYSKILSDALGVIEMYQPAYMVVSLGVDTFCGDPISASGFGLEAVDFTKLGRQLAELTARIDLRTLFVMEGGYANESLGENVVNVLTGFEAR